MATEYDKLTFQTKQFESAAAGSSVLDSLFQPPDSAVDAEQWKRDRGTTTQEPRDPGDTLDEDGLGGFETVKKEPNEGVVRYNSIDDIWAEASAHRDRYKDRYDAVSQPNPNP